MWSTHMISFSLAMKGNSDTYYNVKEPWGHDIKWNKPDMKGQTLHNSTYLRWLA